MDMRELALSRRLLFIYFPLKYGLPGIVRSEYADLLYLWNK